MCGKMGYALLNAISKIKIRFFTDLFQPHNYSLCIILLFYFLLAPIPLSPHPPLPSPPLQLSVDTRPSSAVLQLQNRLVEPVPHHENHMRKRRTMLQWCRESR